MMRSLGVCLLLAAASAADAQTTPLLASPSERGVILRWVWSEGARPAGYFVERRPAGASTWTRLTARPLTRIRERAEARAIAGAQFERYEGLLFPGVPGGLPADPETYRSMLLLSADLEPGVAHVLGLRYDDATAASGSAYEYRLIELTASGERVAAATGAVTAGAYRAAPGPDALVAGSSTRGASLRWAAAPRFSGYHVYRGSRRSIAVAQRVNDAPIIVFTRDEGVGMDASPSFFTDSAPPADSVFYWVRGIDAFGRLSEPSAPVPFVHRAPVAIDAPVVLQSRVAGDTVVVSWQPPASSRATRYQLWRAETDTGPYVRVGQHVRAPAREQRDPGRPARRVTWYRVSALDDAGHESERSAATLAEVPDRDPPAAPDSLVAVVDTGRISLRWRRVAATDLRGYRVYRSSEATGTFALLTVAPTMANAFVDSVPRRADHPFYYRVTAVDSAFNEGRPSAVLVARPPDATPPSAPHISRVRKLEGAIVVSWSPNPEPDVSEYRPRVRARGETAWRAIPGRIPSAQLSDTITGLTSGRSYEITVFAVDDAGNVSAPASLVVATPARPRSLERPDLRNAAFDSRRHEVILTWTASATVREVLIFRRAEGDRSPRLLGSAAAGVTRFSDPGVRSGQEYEYTIRARDAFGNEAESRTRRVRVPGAGS